MTIDEAIPKLARALQHAADEHGRPNTFSCGELQTLHGGPPAILAGRIGKDFNLRHRVWQALGGHEVWGSCPRYNRRWAI